VSPDGDLPTVGGGAAAAVATGVYAVVAIRLSLLVPRPRCLATPGLDRFIYLLGLVAAVFTVGTMIRAYRVRRWGPVAAYGVATLCVVIGLSFGWRVFGAYPQPSFCD
jgi:hypothetical protein